VDGGGWKVEGRREKVEGRRRKIKEQPLFSLLLLISFRLQKGIADRNTLYLLPFAFYRLRGVEVIEM
jgi:hypothetical protein